MIKKIYLVLDLKADVSGKSNAYMRQLIEEEGHCVRNPRLEYGYINSLTKYKQWPMYHEECCKEADEIHILTESDRSQDFEKWGKPIIYIEV
mgnify:CR=1 FL=1